MDIFSTIKDKAIFIQFPKTKTNPYTYIKKEDAIGPDNFIYMNYGDDIEKRTIKLPIGETYHGWYLNHHHFTTKYHRETLMPILSDILKFNYNPNDFEIIEKTNEEGFDISLLSPKQEILYDANCYTRKQIDENVGYRDLIYAFIDKIEYHRIYKYGHECSKVTNKTTNSNRKLIISGDSQMIPSIMPLTLYFKEISYFDNRTCIRCFDKQEIECSDILFATGFNEFSKYSSRNLL